MARYWTRVRGSFCLSRGTASRAASCETDRDPFGLGFKKWKRRKERGSPYEFLFTFAPVPTKGPAGSPGPPLAVCRPATPLGVGQGYRSTVDFKLQIGGAKTRLASGTCRGDILASCWQAGMSGGRSRTVRQSWAFDLRFLALFDLGLGPRFQIQVCLFAG